MKISALICVHQDTEYLPLVLEQIYHIVDEVVFIDGPYKWLIDTMADLPFDHSSRLSEIRFQDQPIRNLPKVKYYHGVWKNEIEKRAFGYDACTSELVLVVDSDEIFEIDLNLVEKFWSSPEWVGKLHVFSLARTFARAEYPADAIEFAVANADKPHEYYRFFKRSLITGTEHVAFLQVLHPVRSEPLDRPDRSRVFPTSLGMIFHLCVMRTGHNNLVKYLFYISAWRVEHDKPDPILNCVGWSSYSEMLKEITLDEYLSILVRGGSDSIRCPGSRIITPFSQMPKKFVDRVRYSDEPYLEFGLPLSKPLLVLNGYPIFLYLPTFSDSPLECQIHTEDVRSIDVREFRAFYCKDNRKSYKGVYSGEVSSNTLSVILEPYSKIDGEDLFARLLLLQATPQSGKSVGRISQIELSTVFGST